MSKYALIICGPTSSGKSELAHYLASQCNGEIVNIDSMQVYSGLETLTSVPLEFMNSGDLKYHLYGCVVPGESMSAVKHIQMLSIIRNIVSRGKNIIIVGGTGLYIKMLVNGYHYIPDIPDQVRLAGTRLLEELGVLGFYEYIRSIGAYDGEGINDKRRMLRAYEVFVTTGKSITFFQQGKRITKFPDFNFGMVLLNPERYLIYERSDARIYNTFDISMNEVCNVLRYTNKALRTLKSIIGGRELIRYINGIVSREEAINMWKVRTRHYIKRQITWFKHQVYCCDKLCCESISELPGILQYVRYKMV